MERQLQWYYGRNCILRSRRYKAACSLWRRQSAIFANAIVLEPTDRPTDRPSDERRLVSLRRPRNRSWCCLAESQDYAGYCYVRSTPINKGCPPTDGSKSDTSQRL